MAATVCVSNIPSSITEEELGAFFEDRHLPLNDERSGILFTKAEGGKMRTTVSFADEETFKKACDLSRAEKKLNGSTLIFDHKFFGITVISEGTQADIVAVHGMNGHAFNSWEYHDNDGESFMWLRDCLPERIPNARVMIYGYSAPADSDVSAGRIRTFAETFLETTLRVRKGIQDVNRPLILLGHSLGGLIIKQALIIANSRADGRFDSLINSVRGTIFIGTPHRGLNGVDTPTFIANFLGASTGNISELVAEQHPSSTVLFDLTDDFKQLIEAKKIGVATLYETKKTECKHSDPVWIVDEQSATLGVAEERRIGIDADHINLCKFDHPGVDSLETIIGYIEEYCIAPTPNVTPHIVGDQPPPPYRD